MFSCLLRTITQTWQLVPFVGEGISARHRTFGEDAPCNMLATCWFEVFSGKSIVFAETNTKATDIPAGSCPLRGSKIWNGSSSESYRCDAWWRHARNTTGALLSSLFLLGGWGGGFVWICSVFCSSIASLGDSWPDEMGFPSFRWAPGLYFCHQDPWAETLVPRSLGNFTIHDPSGSSTQCDSFQCCNLCLWSQWLLGRCMEM